ncbi:uncharacterized protein LOC135392252 [Ornithodoros turicata]|uniref:uncharacterized protein LOC135392252 n=1 Tax=Ornithodoros turicata TaxID=34597 RepID=UPI0031387894
MGPEQFDILHRLVEKDLTKAHLCREPISSAERLAFTLRYLSSGIDFKDVAMAYRVGIETAREAIHLTCGVLWEKLKDLYMKPPSPTEWAEISRGFAERWQFRNCIGDVDGKHVRIVAPKRTGSLYYNYKGTFSVVLMAVVDSRYRFVLIDVGAEGRQSDSGVFKASPIGHHLESGTLGIPGIKKLPNSDLLVPHVFIGDEAFQLRRDFLRPYSGLNQPTERRAFNLRLSRARAAKDPLGDDPQWLHLEMVAVRKTGRRHAEAGVATPILSARPMGLVVRNVQWSTLQQNGDEA